MSATASWRPGRCARATLCAPLSSKRKRHLARVAIAVTVSGLTCLWVAPAGADMRLDAGPGWIAHTLFVSAVATAGGNGTRNAPFNSLSAAEAASEPGDTIVVLPAPSSVGPLDGGIALQPDQTLVGAGPSVVTLGSAPDAAPRITNSSASQNFGDAVELASGDVVRNLQIVNSYRGAIYGSNIQDAMIFGNDIVGADTSCTAGYVTYFQATLGFKSGWAAIMVDDSAGSSVISIDNNYIHDSGCSDGIDIRAFGTATMRAEVNRNEVTRLTQGAGFGGVYGLAVQTRDSARLSVNSSGNSETYLGNPGADAGGLQSSQTGGTLTWNIADNTYAHGTGVSTTNGAEFFTAAGSGTENLRISRSTFYDNPGDMIEENNWGNGSTVRLTLRGVNLSHTTRTPVPSPQPFVPALGFGSLTGLGFCVSQFSIGAHATTELRMVDSHVSDCDTDGVMAFYGPVPPFGSSDGTSSTIDIERSTITNVRGYALHWVNYGQLGSLAIRAQNSTFSSASGAATVAFDQAPGATTANPAIDFGGGSLGSPGRNCITGSGGLAAQDDGYDVFLQRDWWGSPLGPQPQQLSVADGTLYTEPALSEPPPNCS